MHAAYSLSLKIFDSEKVFRRCRGASEFLTFFFASFCASALYAFSTIRLFSLKQSLLDCFCTTQIFCLAYVFSNAEPDFMKLKINRLTESEIETLSKLER